MYLGSRRVRSAGRASGSIELTLPTTLRMLEGIECRLTIRDGARPELVLQPDLSISHDIFTELWQKLRLGLSEVGEIGDFVPADYSLALFPPRHWEARPPLAYADALLVAQQRASEQCREVEPLARLLAFLSVGAAHRLGLSGNLALAFGDSVAYLITGVSAGLGTDCERGMAYRAFWGNHKAQALGSPRSDRVWRAAQAGLRRVFDEFCLWQGNLEAYEQAREHWYRAFAVEPGMRFRAAPMQPCDGDAPLS